MRLLVPTLRSALFLLVAALAGPVSAQTPPAAPTASRDSSAHLRFGGDVVVPADAREGAVVVVRGNATIRGTARGVVVLEGDARIEGGTVQELSVVRGQAILSDSARVEGDIHLLDATLATEPGSVVLGRVERGVGRQVARHFVRGVALIGFGVLLAMVLGGVFAVAVFPDSIRATGAMIRSDTGRVLGATALLWLAFPIVAGLLIPTLIGLPLGLGYFLFILPALAFIGLIVSGTWLGDLMLHRMATAERPRRPTIAAAMGITILLLVGRIPIIGIVATALVLLGTGAVALQTLRAMRASATGPTSPTGASI